MRVIVLILAENLTKTFKGSLGRVDALDGVSFRIQKGEFAAVVGASGSGKSTLMNILGLLDRPSSGRYVLSGLDTAELSEGRRAALRSRDIGFVFQNYSLVPRLTALENTELPLSFRGYSPSARRAAAKAALERVGLEARMHHFPSQLSGGQQQRVALARAISGGPSLILADEPTGNLDPGCAAQILSLLKELNGSGVTVLLITHDPSVAADAPRVLTINDGKLTSDVKNRKVGIL